MAKSLICILQFLFIVAIHAQNPILDTSFNHTGKVTTNIQLTPDYAWSVLEQPDGKILVGGKAGAFLGSDYAVVRYHHDGRIDSSFGIDGKSIHDISGSSDQEGTLLLQDDGKIIIGGYSFHVGFAAHTDFIVSMVRLLPNGELDTLFADKGKIKTKISFGALALTSLLLQPDGKILSGGYAQMDNNDWEFIIVRYDTMGFKDTTFGNGGIAVADFDSSLDIGYSIALQADGKIIMAGAVSADSTLADFALMRFNTDGSIDSTFGTDGRTRTDFGDSNEEPFYVTVLTNGKILTCGYTDAKGDKDFALAQYTSNGILDNTFGNNGITVTGFGRSIEHGYKISIQDDGRIVATGYSNNNLNKFDFAIARYHEDGTLDASFGSQGTFLFNFNQSIDFGYGNTLQNDGKLLAVGTSDEDFAIARFITDINVGILNPSINSNSTFIYPNPIENIFNIKYELDKDSKLSIELLDINGKSIAVLVNHQSLPKGLHSEQLELPKHLAPGIYFINLNTNRSITAVKIIKL